MNISGIKLKYNIPTVFRFKVPEKLQLIPELPREMDNAYTFRCPE
jgi:hypothetical protein